MNNRQFINTWLQASENLNIKIKVPFKLTFDNKEIRFELHVEDFGSKNGTVVFDMDDMTQFHLPEKYGYYCSAVNTDLYKTYDKQHFIDLLNDWGYHGDKSLTPSWYTGTSWTK